MNPQQVQTLVLRAPHGPGVAHLIVRVPEVHEGDATPLLSRLAQSASFGPRDSGDPCLSIGFSFAGLEALRVPEAYLRLFRRLAPAFRDGAVRRSVRLGDSGASAAPNWRPEFRQNHAHVVLSWHGEFAQVRNQATAFAEEWNKAFSSQRTWRGERARAPTKDHAVLLGERLGRPKGETGEWVHFGYRDGLSEVCIDNALRRPGADDPRDHAPGELLLGRINDAGFNTFALNRAPAKVRAFFLDGSFGILRPMQQDLAAFEAAINRWVEELQRVFDEQVTRDFVKAKLCGRWPNGQRLRPGELRPADPPPKDPMALNLADDPVGEGCPFGSHVRRMQAAPAGNVPAFKRPLQRCSFPFGRAVWSDQPVAEEPRGLLGHFFCSSIENQFEHLLGQWAARAPLGFPSNDGALDPMIGPHTDAEAALVVPLSDRPPQRLQGFGAWTTTLGTMYAWYPSHSALNALLDEDFVREEDEGPWL